MRGEVAKDAVGIHQMKDARFVGCFVEDFTGPARRRLGFHGVEKGSIEGRGRGRHQRRRPRERRGLGCLAGSFGLFCLEKRAPSRLHEQGVFKIKRAELFNKALIKTEIEIHCFFSCARRSDIRRGVIEPLTEWDIGFPPAGGNGIAGQ